MKIWHAFQWRSLQTRVTLTTLAIFVVSLWSLAFYASRVLREDIGRLLGAQQFSMVSYIAGDLDESLAERVALLNKAAGELTPELFANPAELQRVLEQRRILLDGFNGGIAAMGADGTVIADVPRSAGRIGVNYLDVDVASGVALRQGKTAIGPPVMGKKLRAPVFVMVAPVRDRRGKVIGALAGVTNLGIANFLDRFTRSRYGAAGTYLLVAPQYHLVVTASDKRRAMEAVPAAGVSPLIDRYAAGYEGSGVFVNPQGVEVLSSAKGIPAAGWYVVASLPTSEAYVPIRALQSRMLLAAVFLTVLAGVLSWWLLRRQLRPLLSAAEALAARSDMNRLLQPLPVIREDEIGQLVGGFNRLLDTLGQREEALRESEERYRTAFLTSPDAVNINRVDDGLYLEFNEGFLRLTGWTREQIVGRTSREINIWKNRDDRQRLLASLERDGYCENFEAEFVAKDGRVVTGLMSAHLITLRGVPCILSVTRDISSRKAAEDEIRNLAFYDPLTRLPNRRLLLDRLQQAVASSTRNGRYGALLMIDLDDFKTLNDTLGHDIGDLLLQQVAGRLNTCVREGDTVARLGGDEFVVMLEFLSESATEAAAHAEAVGEKILASLNQRYQLASYPHHSTPSIGVTLFVDHQGSLEELLKRADLAMYRAKSAGRNTLRFFEPEMQAAVTARAALEAGLREALQQGQFLLHYQAQMDFASRVTGVEALVRWQHPGRGLVSPAEFIPLAEESGLILPLGHWVLEAACSQLAAWAEEPSMAALTVAVNVSARQFRQQDFAAQVLAILERTGANPARLKLELTESLLVDDVEGVISRMTALKAKGVGFSLDDFGMGYSSLASLKRLPLDQLKIDQSFVRDVLVDPNDAAIARMVIALAGSMGLEIIAEGVETEAQRDFLASEGCHAYQGYLFSRPLPLAGFEAFASLNRKCPRPL